MLLANMFVFLQGQYSEDLNFSHPYPFIRPPRKALDLGRGRIMFRYSFGPMLTACDIFQSPQ